MTTMEKSLNIARYLCVGIADNRIAREWQEVFEYLSGMPSGMTTNPWMTST